MRKMLLIVAAFLLFATACEWSADQYYKVGGKCATSAASIEVVEGEDDGDTEDTLYVKGYGFARVDDAGEDCSHVPWTVKNDRVKVNSIQLIHKNGAVCQTATNTGLHEGPDSVVMQLTMLAEGVDIFCEGYGEYKTRANVSVYWAGAYHNDVIDSPYLQVG